MSKQDTPITGSRSFYTFEIEPPLPLTILWTYSADDKLIFFFTFPRKMNEMSNHIL